MKQTGWKHHEWGVVAQTPRAQIDAGEPYIEVAYCPLCGKYRVYGDEPTRTLSARPHLPAEFWL